MLPIRTSLIERSRNDGTVSTSALRMRKVTLVTPFTAVGAGWGVAFAVRCRVGVVPGVSVLRAVDVALTAAVRVALGVAVTLGVVVPVRVTVAVVVAVATTVAVAASVGVVVGV